jgi:hypothetical protein
VLKSQSQAIANALKQYNAAAAALSPPHHQLIWNEVIQYGFLSEFDLLKDTCDDMQNCPWTRPAMHALMDCHFKIEHTYEEVTWLNVEICCMVTHLQDEDHFLHKRAQDLASSQPLLSHQILKYHAL